MDSPKRAKEEIVANILEACRCGPIGKTRIVYTANMNFNTLKPYLAALIKSGLLVASEGKFTSYRTYRTTSKGMDTLKRIRECQELLFSDR